MSVPNKSSKSFLFSLLVCVSLIYIILPINCRAVAMTKLQRSDDNYYNNQPIRTNNYKMSDSPKLTDEDVQNERKTYNNQQVKTLSLKEKELVKKMVKLLTSQLSSTIDKEMNRLGIEIYHDIKMDQDKSDKKFYEKFYSSQHNQTVKMEQKHNGRKINDKRLHKGNNFKKHITY